MKYRMRLLNRLAGIVVAGLLATACTNEDWIDSTGGEAMEGFQVSLTMDGMRPATRSVESVSSLNEDVVKRMDVFLFGPSEEFMQYATAGDVNGTTDVEKVTLYKGSSWKNNFEDDKEYTLYVLANYKGSADLSTIKTVQGLKDLVATDADIAKYEDMNEGTETEPKVYKGKTFLMDGKKVFKGNDLDKNLSTLDIPVDVKRAAVKIEVTLKFSDKWKEKFTATDLKAQFAHYATATTALAEAPMLDADERGFTTYPAATSNVLNRFSTAPVFEKGEIDGRLHNGSKIRFYAYVNNWQQEISNETMFLIDLPGNIIVDAEYPENKKELAHNFYKIPIVPNGEEQNLSRNTFYQVTAVVDMEGSSTVDVPVVLEDVTCTVAEWKPTTIDVGTGDNPEYLMLNEYHVEIRNVDGYDGIRFYSSSPIEKVEVVGFDNQAAADEAGVDFQYPGDKTLEGSGWYEEETDEIPGAFYVNKDNMRKSVSGVTATFDPNVTDGWIHLKSGNPENVTKRYITLKVTNKDGQSKYVVVEQYPLEYIQPIAGYYSYRDDFLSSSSANPSGVPCGYEMTFYTNSSKNPTKVSTTGFESKVFTDRMRTYSFSSTRNGSQYKWTASASRSGYSLNNNMMYFVTITKTSDSYKIAHPVMVFDEDMKQMVAVSSSENDMLVSPAFMLASQLGAVTANSFNWTTAQEHCAYYVETYKDKEGKTHFLDDWRLPTSKELEVIVKYQLEATEVMDQVVAGDYYYISYQYGGSNRNGKGPGAGTANGTGVRCIRDVKPTDEFLQK